MHRPTLGAIAIVLLAGSLILWAGGFKGDNYTALQAAFTRVGLIVAALWLAHPQLSALPNWLATLTVGSAAAVAWRPRLAWLAVPLVAVYVLLRPKGSKRTAPQSTPSSAKSAQRTEKPEAASRKG